MGDIKHEKVGPGMSISWGFTSLEEALAEIQKKTDEANRRLLPEQRDMITCRKDQYFVNISVNIFELFIAGVAYSMNSFKKQELGAYRIAGVPPLKVEDLSKEDQETYLWTVKNYEENRARGYIFSKCYSKITPEGELGDTHAYSMWPITEAAFEEAKAQRWKPDLLDEEKSINLRGCLRELAARMQ